MSFLQHLEELRKRLIISIVAVVICMGIASPPVPSVQKVITRPLNEPSITQRWHYAIESFVLQKFPDAAKDFGLEQPEPPKVNPHKLNYMAPLEPFFVQMKISLISGLALAFPVDPLPAVALFAPALYPKEGGSSSSSFPSAPWPLSWGICSFSTWSGRWSSPFPCGMRALPLLHAQPDLVRQLLPAAAAALRPDLELPLVLLILARVGLVGVESCDGSGVGHFAQRRGGRLPCRRAHHDGHRHPHLPMYDSSILTVRLFGRPAPAAEDVEAGAAPGGNGSGPALVLVTYFTQRCPGRVAARQILAAGQAHPTFQLTESGTCRYIDVLSGTT